MKLAHVFLYITFPFKVIAECGEAVLADYWADLMQQGVYPIEAVHMRMNDQQRLQRMFHKRDLPDHRNSNLFHVSKSPDGGTSLEQLIMYSSLVTSLKNKAASSNTPFTHMCESGLNAGVSALSFLCGANGNTSTSNDVNRAGGNVSLTSFDLRANEVPEVATRLLNRRYPNLHVAVFGSSLDTLPSKLYQKGFICHFVSIDGGHIPSIVYSDFVHFHALSPHGTTVVIDNCNVNNLTHHFGGMKGVNAGYWQAQTHGLVRHVKQVMTGICGGKDLTCREVCVGEFI
mmetsp:Transcript_17377/g.17465  ORF Transcript_17377/g.17465 Transcript_17377/m.17465 type:complete len:287 (+) Transcript_17377:201-1061(+)